MKDSEQTSSRAESTALVIYLIGLLVAMWAASTRMAAEKQHETTEIVLDFASFLSWDADFEPPGTLAQKLLQHRVSSLAFAELHLDELEDRGELVVQTTPEFALTLKSGALGSFPQDVLDRIAEQTEGRQGTFLLFTEPQLASALVSQLKVLFGSEVLDISDRGLIWVPQSIKSLRSVGLGFDRQQIEEYHKLGFSIWLRPENRTGLDAEKLDKLYQAWSELSGVQGVVFGGGLNEALGYPDLLDESAEHLRRLGWKVGYIELPPRAQQKGLETTVRELPHQTVRVLAVSPLHQAKLSPFRVLGMYSLGSRERNIRLLYVRPFAVAGRPELDEEFLFSLADELENQGPASLFQEGQNTAPSTLFLMLYCLSGGALALMLCLRVGLPYHHFLWGILAIACIGGLAATAIGKGTLFRSLLALAIGTAAPTYGFLRWVFPAVDRPADQAGLWDGLKLLVLVSLASLSAGMFVAGLLSDTTFLLGLDRFRGVKLLTLGTPLLVVACFLARRYSAGAMIEGLKSPLAVYQAGLAGLLALILGFLVLRSGNASGGAASESERTLRVILDQWLGVRPRFKEFMLAHPAMLCTPFFARKTGFLPSLVLVLLAGIGQAGIVDTFAHVHTPLDVTLIRVVLGVVIGGIVGSLALAGYNLVGRPLEEKIRRGLNS